jgi:hypothetical protein
MLLATFEDVGWTPEGGGELTQPVGAVLADVEDHGRARGECALHAVEVVAGENVEAPRRETYNEVELAVEPVEGFIEAEISYSVGGEKVRGDDGIAEGFAVASHFWLITDPIQYPIASGRVPSAK